MPELSLILLCVTVGQDLSGYPLSQIYDNAVEYIQEGELELAANAFAEIMTRMPHLGRARYDAAGVLFEMEMYADADTLLSAGDLGVEADSAASASAASLLGTSIAAGDYAGVETAYNQLREIITAGSSSHDCDLTNYEVAINWLRNNEPPEDQSQDQQDQAEDQQDQSEDQQDQSEDQQDQSEDQQEEEMPTPHPPMRGEMTREDAERILDQVEEAEPPDSSEGAKGFTTSGPVW